MKSYSRITGKLKNHVLQGERPWAPSGSAQTTREAGNPESCSTILLSTPKQVSKLIHSSVGRDRPEQKGQQVKVPKLRGLSKTETYILLNEKQKIPEQTCTLK